MMRNRILIVSAMLFFCIDLYADIFQSDNSALLYGPGYVAVTENINSILVNPAGLYKIFYTEFMINFDRLYAFNYAAIAHFFQNFGNIGISFFNDVSTKKQYSTLAFGTRFFRSVKGYDQDVLAAGINASYIFNNFLKSDETFSVNPGLLFIHKNDVAPLKNFSAGFSTFDLFDSSSSVNFNFGISTTFKLMNRNFLILALGSDFDRNFRHRSYSFNIDVELFKDIFVNLGTKNNIMSVGLSIKKFKDNFYSGIVIDYIKQSYSASITYRRSIFPDLKKEIIKNENVQNTQNKSPKQKKQADKNKTTAPIPQEPKVNEEDLLEQKDLVQEGIDLYSNNELYPAVEKWKQVLTISSNTDYAKQALVYIQITEKEIESLKKK